MPEIRMRPKHQVTLPASIVRQAAIKADDRLAVEFINGAIIITPVSTQPAAPSDDVMSFAGIGHGLWGATTAEVETTVRSLRQEWER